LRSSESPVEDRLVELERSLDGKRAKEWLMLEEAAERLSCSL
jgi:hypothetical protein